MKLEVFSRFVKEVFEGECMQIMNSKGVAYSGQEDKFGNFKRIAKKLNLTPFKVWAVYFNKHLDALDSWFRGEYKDSERIEGRIVDLINYLFLLYGMIVEAQAGTDEITSGKIDRGDVPIFNEEGHSNEEKV